MDQAASVLRRYIEGSKVAPKELDRVRERMLRNLLGLQRSPDFLAQTVSAQLLYGSQSDLGRPRYPSRLLLERVTTEDVEAAFTKLLTTDRAELLVAGGYGSLDFVDILPALPKLDSSRAASVVGDAAKGRFHIACDGGKTSRLLIAWRLPPRGGEQDPALSILSRILAGGVDSRLGAALRSVGGMTYGVRSRYEATAQASSLVIDVDVDSRRLAQAYELIQDELTAIVGTRPIRESEVRSLAQTYRGKLLSSLESPVQVLGKIRDLMAHGETVDDLKKLVDRIGNLSTEDMNGAFAQYLKSEPMVLTIGSSLPGARAKKLGDDLLLTSD